MGAVQCYPKDMCGSVAPRFHCYATHFEFTKEKRWWYPKHGVRTEHQGNQREYDFQPCTAQ